MKIYYIQLRGKKKNDTQSFFFSHEPEQKDEFEKEFPNAMKEILKIFKRKFLFLPSDGLIAEFDDCDSEDFLEIQKSSIDQFHTKEIQFEYSDGKVFWKETYPIQWFGKGEK